MKSFSLFNDEDHECNCGGDCCGGQTLGSMLGALERISPTGGTDDTGGGTTTTNCIHGNPYTDPNGVVHCPSGPPPTCGAGYHVQGNYVGDLICAPNECPAGTHMGWTTDGRQVVCTPNAPTPTTQSCPAGYHLNPVSGNCVRDVPSTSGVLPSPPIAEPAGLFGLSPLMLGAIAIGGIFLFSSMGDDKKSGR